MFAVFDPTDSTSFTDAQECVCGLIVMDSRIIHPNDDIHWLFSTVKFFCCLHEFSFSFFFFVNYHIVGLNQYVIAEIQFQLGVFLFIHKLHPLGQDSSLVLELRRGYLNLNQQRNYA